MNENWEDLDADVHGIEIKYATIEQVKNYLDSLPHGFIWCPSSIHHGYPIKRFDAATLAKIQEAQFLEFIDFLFEKHCNHISQREAWLEFRAHELGLTLTDTP